MKKQFIPSIILNNKKAVSGFYDRTVISNDPVALSISYNDAGCDSIIIFDQSDDDLSHEEALDIIKEICSNVDVPVIGAGNVKRMEDIKKLLYAGCKMAALNFSKTENAAILEEVSKKFGKDKIAVCYADTQLSKKVVEDNADAINMYASKMIYLPRLSVLDCDNQHESFDYDYNNSPKDTYNENSNIDLEESLMEHPVVVLDSVKSIPHIVYLDNPKANVSSIKGSSVALLLSDKICAVTGSAVSVNAENIVEIKDFAIEAGIDVERFESRFKWEDFKLDSNGLIPVVVQDYRTDQVLMVAYMNEESYNATLRTGKMTYYSRSRKTLWEKGDTSGHYQYVKSLACDCDLDTILAKVKQIGAACHTGSYSCFFNEIAKKDYTEKNPQKVLDSVYNVIADRKVNKREGSYTNYLFDKGLDKILKKCGEEATEITIAAKNENKNELVYEISDYLYHMMVLMVEKGVSWKDVTDELSRR